MEEKNEIERLQGEVSKLRSKISTLEDDKVELKYHLELEYLISEISNDLLNSQDTQIDDGINRALKAISQFAGASRSSLFILSEDFENITNTHEWCAFEEDSQIKQLQNIPFSMFGYHQKQLLKREVVKISTIDDYPSDAVQEREWVKANGFRSMVFVPLIYKNNLYGALGFYSEIGNTIVWKKMFIDFLKYIGNIFISAIEHEKTESKLNSNE